MKNLTRREALKHLAMASAVAVVPSVSIADICVGHSAHTERLISDVKYLVSRLESLRGEKYNPVSDILTVFLPADADERAFGKIFYSIYSKNDIFVTYDYAKHMHVSLCRYGMPEIQRELRVLTAEACYDEGVSKYRILSPDWPENSYHGQER